MRPPRLIQESTAETAKFPWFLRQISVMAPPNYRSFKVGSSCSPEVHRQWQMIDSNGLHEVNSAL